MNRQDAIDALSDGHFVYGQAYADEVCDALGVPRVKGKPTYSDPPDVWKGLVMDPEAEGTVCVLALDLGATACDFYHLHPMACFGRGSQGRAYANALRQHFGMAEEV
jgi:hypothetical protein